MTIDAATSRIEAMIMPVYLKNQIIDLVKEIEPGVINNTVVRTKYIAPPYIDLVKIAKEVEQDTGITLTQMRSKSRKRPIVEARCQFVRTVLTKDILYNRVELGEFINKNHASIYWYAEGKHNDCGIDPLKISKKYSK